MHLSSLGREEVRNVECRRLPETSGKFRSVPFFLILAYFGGSPLRRRSEAVVIFLCCPPPTMSNSSCLTRFLIWRIGPHPN
jgi:hypothetical protein